jgi:hypothetical protein
MSMIVWGIPDDPIGFVLQSPIGGTVFQGMSLP